MRLISLELTNICQHEHLKWEFDKGLIGIYGPNGSGKSNALNLACYAGFTNDYSRHSEGKSGYVRQQASGKDKAEIKLRFEHDSDEFEIIRGLQAPLRHRMKFLNSDRKELTKASEIQAELEDVLGIRRRLIDDFIFVNQWQLFSFLSVVPSERAKSFAHLCGTTKAEQIWEMLKDQVNADSSLIQETTGDADEIRKQLGEYKERIRKEKERQSELQGRVLSDSDCSDMQALVDKRIHYDRLSKQIPACVKVVKTLKQKAVEANKTRKATKADYEALRTTAAEDDEKLEQVISRLASLDEASKKWKRRERLLAEAADVKKLIENHQLAKQDDPGFDVARLTDSRDSIISQIREYESLLGISGEPSCPVCGTPTDSLHDAIAAAEETLPDLRERLEQIADEVDTQQKWVVRNERWKNKDKELSRSAARLKEELQELSDAEEVDGDTVNKLLTEKAEINDRKRALAESKIEMDDADKKFELAKTKHQVLKADAERLKTEREGYQISDYEYGSAKDSLERHTAATSALAVSRSVVKELKGFADSRKKELLRIKKIRSRSKKARRWLNDLQDVRDEVMHRDKLPKVVHRNNLLDMEEDINESLSMFNSPFSIRTTEDVGFVSHFPNGTIMPASGLSGGQKVMLAVPYRLTVNSLFATQVGMMVLDEPTDGLDSENRDLAAQVFVKLGEVARSRGHQVIVITHDEALASAFDQKFVLERPV